MNSLEKFLKKTKTPLGIFIFIQKASASAEVLLDKTEAVLLFVILDEKVK